MTLEVTPRAEVRQVRLPLAYYVRRVVGEPGYVISGLNLHEGKQYYTADEIQQMIDDLQALLTSFGDNRISNAVNTELYSAARDVLVEYGRSTAKARKLESLLNAIATARTSEL